MLPGALVCVWPSAATECTVRVLATVTDGTWVQGERIAGLQHHHSENHYCKGGVKSGDSNTIRKTQGASLKEMRERTEEMFQMRIRTEKWIKQNVFSTLK